MNDARLKIARAALASLEGTGKRIHGLSKMPEFNVWMSMRHRCRAVGGHKHYGQRGIRVCERWQNDFLAFIVDMGPRPSPEHEIDRIDVNGNYEPSNCRWATRSEQMSNRRHLPRRTNRGAPRTIEVFGKTYALSDICRELGLPLATIAARLDNGWSVEDALNEPIAKIGMGAKKKKQSKFFEHEDGCSYVFGIPMKESHLRRK